jgi:hypothetical protein
MNIYEFLPWLGLLGFLLTATESYFVGDEINKLLHEYTIDLSVILLSSVFAFSLVIFTSISPFFIKRCSASMFNIALVSQIFWSYIVEIISGKASPRGYEYYLGFAIIIIGIYLFNKYPVIDIKVDNSITHDSINKDDKTVTLVGSQSETSSCSAFTPPDKYTHLRNNTLSHNANKYLNNE